ncbi:MAG: AraC family transcriptional regulator [Eubacteriales bacterium]|nr:AraC family transcriptional regulator [bacterium]MDY2792790.1 AraC family transcriptional regulator [Eubacteriales bacterium]
MQVIGLEELAREDVAFARIQAAKHTWPRGNSTLYQGEGRQDNMVFFMLEGRRSYRSLDGAPRFEVGENDLVLMPAGSCYESVVLSEGGSRGVCLQFSLLDEAGQWRRLGTQVVVLRQKADGLRALVEEIAAASLQYGSRLRVMALMMELFSRLCAPPLTGEGAELLPAIRYMEEHLERPIPAADLAARCHMSLSTFTRRFRTLTGEPPAAYHRHMRLKKGRELLSSGLYTVEQAALTLGFFDAAHFCHAYRDCFGQAPGEARGHGAR